MLLIRFTFFGQVIGKPRMTQSDKWKNPPRPAVSRWYAFKDHFYLTARAAGYHPDYKINQCHVVAYLPGKKGIPPGAPHQSAPDADNIFKAVLDALTINDSGCWKISTEKYIDDGQGSRLEVTL
jgi:Holliday junction resolvase RusA-like endonuclease